MSVVRAEGKVRLCVADPVVNDIDIRWLTRVTVIGHLIRSGYLRDESSLSRHSTRTSIGPSLSRSYLASLSLPASLCLSFLFYLRCLSCCSFTPVAAQCGHSNDILIVCLQMRMKWVSEEIAMCRAINRKLGMGGLQCLAWQMLKEGNILALWMHEITLQDFNWHHSRHQLKMKQYSRKLVHLPTISLK